MDEQKPMQDSKDRNLSGERNVDDRRGESKQDQSGNAAAKDSSEADGWQQYRRWISKAPAPRSRRSSVDPSLYTWKGYRNWSEQIRRNWSDT